MSRKVVQSSPGPSPPDILRDLTEHVHEGHLQRGNGGAPDALVAAPLRDVALQVDCFCQG